MLKSSSELVADDYQSTTAWPGCATKDEMVLGIPAALDNLAAGGAAKVVAAMASGLRCAVADPTPGTIYFNFSSHYLDMKDRIILDTVAEHMGTPGWIDLTGYTCNIGSDKANQIISEKRALAVKAYLVAKGIEESRIITRGKGKRNPVASNDREESRMMNRRVEMSIFR